MKALNWQTLTRKKDLTKFFNWVLFSITLILVLPIDTYMRVVTAQTYEPLAWTLLLPLPAYMLFFSSKFRGTILILSLLNAGSFLFTLGYYYTAILTPLVQNIGGDGVLYTMVYQCLALYGVTFHTLMVLRFSGLK